jgi:flagellum-specific peptidoglycan hydrolase FlgJ
MSIPQFVIDASQNAQRHWQVPACVSIGQWAYESGWGKHMPNASFNPFGIKAIGNEPYVSVPTHEYVRGHLITVEAKFRKFANFDEAFDAHAKLLATAWIYHSAMQAWMTGDINLGIRLMAAHYATDPHYAPVLMSIIHANNLQQYDI